jgi:hypothetical protein
MPRRPRVFVDGAIYHGLVPGIPFSLLRCTSSVSASRSGNGESANRRVSAADKTRQLDGLRTRGKGPAHQPGVCSGR